MSNERRTAVIVDAYTTGNHLAPAFRRLGVDVVHVQSTPELMPSMLPPDLSPYEANLVIDDLDATAARLKEYAPLCVVAGQEPGVVPADALAERLGLPGNGTGLSRARRDKHAMIETLRATGLHCATQFESRDPADLVAWADDHGYPVVVKPLASAATDGVVVCADAGRVRDAAAAILGTEDIFGGANDTALVQSYLDGPEYQVDMVSYAGERFTCGVWRYHKRLVDGHNIYDYDENADPGASPVPELIDYVNAALDALDVQYGPSHAEVIVTPDGPALVEVGVRMAGGLIPELHDECHGTNQADMTALAYTNPQRFLSEYAGNTYRRLRHASLVDGATGGTTGTVLGVDADVRRTIEELSSVYSFAPKKKPGDVLDPTVDLYSTIFAAHLLSDDKAELRADYATIQSLKDSLYRVRP